MNLLVTGGAGFIGSEVIRRWITRPEVRTLCNLDCLTYAGSLDRLRDVANHSKYSYVPLDLREPRPVIELLEARGFDRVVHLAAESHVDRSIRSPHEFLHSNVLGTFHLLEACRLAWGSDCHAKRFIHVSTDEVFGSLGAVGAFHEASPYNPSSPYSASKAAADMLVRAWRHTYGIPAILTHATNNYGPGQHPDKLIPLVIRRLIERKPVPIYGDGSHVRDWLHVADHAEALWQVILHGTPGSTYLIGSQNSWPNLLLVEKICDLFDELAPSFGGGSRALVQSVADRPGHDWRYAIDPSKIRDELGWKPGVDFTEGLRQTIQHYLDHAREA